MVFLSCNFFTIHMILTFYVIYDSDLLYRTAKDENCLSNESTTRKTQFKPEPEVRYKLQANPLWTLILKPKT